MERVWVSTVLVGLAILVAWCEGQSPPSSTGSIKETEAVFSTVDGEAVFEFSPNALEAHGLWVTPRGDEESIPYEPPQDADDELLRSRMTFPLDPGSVIQLKFAGEAAVGFDRVQLATCGAMMLFPTPNRVVIGNLVLGRDARGGLHVYSTLVDPGNPLVVFDALAAVFTFQRSAGSFQLDWELSVSESWAWDVGVPEAAGETVGSLRISATLTKLDDAPLDLGQCAALSPTAGTGAEGPDVIVGDLQNVYRYPTRVGDITAYAVGTTSCNIGTSRANWFQHTNQHPVIIQNLHRLDGRGFQQIGMSWMKHGFYAVSQNLCSLCTDPTNGTQLGVGCSDPYEAPLNGVQNNMSPRSTLNAHTGVFPYPWTGTAPTNAVARRVQVHDADLDPQQNPGASYFIEGHYLMADDAAAGNGDNNASYRQVRIIESFENNFEIVADPTFPTQRGQAAVRAWKDADAEVVETDVRVPGEGLFILAAKARPIEGGWYRYQYALQNLNSDRSARSFSMDLPEGAVVQNTSFHPVNHHSGEPVSQADWTFELGGAHLAWFTQTYEVNQNANAVRFGSVFSFSFDCNVAPAEGKVFIGLFKPGFPGEITANSIAPPIDLVDCNRNGVPDACDIDCNARGCKAPCGKSFDCNANSTPDECEPDCNLNGVADGCDLVDCPEGDLFCGDCNANGVPDGCEPDCDGDGIPDTCELTPDTDGDGVDDCDDECPLTTPADACNPPTFVTCRFNTGFCASLPRYQCVDMHGTPMCGDPPELRCQFGFPCPESYCRYGCRVGDVDSDGDVDLFDAASLLNCFSGSLSSGSESRPSAECLLRFDFDEDADVDLLDFDEFCGVMDRL